MIRCRRHGQLYCIVLECRRDDRRRTHLDEGTYTNPADGQTIYDTTTDDAGTDSRCDTVTDYSAPDCGT